MEHDDPWARWCMTLYRMVEVLKAVWQLVPDVEVRIA
jgi:hypothetical protein